MKIANVQFETDNMTLSGHVLPRLTVNNPTCSNMTAFKKLLSAALFTGILAFFAGCKSIPLDSGNGNIGAYNYGEFQGLYNSTAHTVTNATREAIKQLGLLEVAMTENKFDTTLIVRDSKDLKVQIWVQEVNSRQTLIRIRWGAGGDLPKSRQLYEMVDTAVSGTPAKQHL